MLAVASGMRVAEFVSAATAEADTVAMPTHATGDVIVAFAVRQSNLSPGPSIATGANWTSLDAGNNGVDTFRVAYKIAASASEATGTWADADGIAVIVLRGASDDPMGANADEGGNSSIALFDAIASPEVSDGSSIFAQFAYSTGSHSAFDTPPSGTSMTFRSRASATLTIAVHSADDGAAAYPGGSTALGTTRRYITWVTEIKGGTL